MGWVRGWVGCLLLAGSLAEASSGGAAAARASRWVGLKSLRALSRSGTDDCSGLVKLAFRHQGVELTSSASPRFESGVQSMHRRARHLGATVNVPRRGDLVFFRETYDRNRDGRINDGLTHVGIVERVESNGTLVFIHRTNGGVKRSRLNRAQPRVQRDAKGRVLNDWLRRAEKGHEARLAGELVTGFARVDSSWRPGAPVRLARAPLRRR